MEKITELTPEQEAMLEPHGDAWIEKGLNTGPADRATFESGAKRCYEFSELEWRGRVVWCASSHLVVQAGPIADHIMRSTGEIPGASFAPMSGLATSVHDAVELALGRSVTKEEVAGAVDAGAVRDGWSFYFGGQWGVSWQSRTSFYRDVLKVEFDDDTWDRDAAFSDAEVNCGLWWPHSHFVMACEHPEVLSLEPDNVHCEDGPAIRWRGDNREWDLFVWHGVTVPEWVVMGPSLELIRGEKNTEVRRCAIESFGWDRFIESLGAEPVAVEPDPANPGFDLKLYDVPNSVELYGSEVRLVVMENASLDRDGSRRRFAETVPADIQSPVAAQAWAFDVPEDVYRSMVRAT